MNTTKLYLPDFPKQHKVKDVDVVTLYHEGRFEELDSVVVCKDKFGNVTAIFGQNNWNCLPFSRLKSSNNLNMTEFDRTPELQRELKLLSFGWLFNKCPKKKKALSFSGIRSRFAKLKIAYRFLADNNHRSLKVLSIPNIWIEFENYLISQEYAQGTIEHCFVAINAAIHDASWHKLSLGLAPVKSKKICQRLSAREMQQTLVIPERLCGAIYGKAIKLVERAHPLRQLITDTEKALQDNYLEGKRRVDANVKAGATYKFMNADGSINNRRYTTIIADNIPQRPSHIIAPLANKLSEIPLKDGTDFLRYLGQLTTASYIVCGGFSGMRDSELHKLTSDSYYKDTYEGRDYHMLQSHTFKLGEKRETWVTAASSKIAIELMSSLTEKWQTEVVYPDTKYTNSLWVNQQHRSKKPVLIRNWPERLKRFCTQFHFTITKEDYQECLESNPQSVVA